jgi:hypothetical protein
VVRILTTGGTYSDQWALQSQWHAKSQLSVAATTRCDGSTIPQRTAHSAAGLHRMHFAARSHEVAQVNMTSAAEDHVALRGAWGTVHRDGRSWFRQYEVVLSALRGQKYGSAQNGLCVCVFTVIQKVAIYWPRNRGLIPGSRGRALLSFTNRSEPLWGPLSFLLDTGGSTPGR